MYGTHRTPVNFVLPRSPPYTLPRRLPARGEQDKAFEEALRQDRAASAGKEAKAIATAGKIAQPVDFGAKEDTQGGLSLGGARVDLTSQEGETAAQRRAKIAQSFARLGLGS